MFSFSHINARSIISGLDLFRDYFYANSYDFVAVTETWLTAGMADDGVSLDGYALVRRDREDGRRAGGVALYIKNNFTFTLLNLSPVNVGFEHLWVKITLSGISVVVGVIYRPPSSDIALFFESFESLLSDVILNTHEIVILGDFNINLLDVNHRNSILFTNMCDTLGIKQIIDEPTRVTATFSLLIDFILLSSHTLVPICGVKHDLLVSDHCLIFVRLNLSQPPRAPLCRTFRDFHNFCHEGFLNDIQTVPWHRIYTVNDINEKLHIFNNLVIELFNIHAPFKTGYFRKARAPWLTDNIRFMMSLRDKALRDARLRKTVAAFNYYKQLRNYTTSAIRREKRADLRFVSENSDSKRLWDALRLLNIYSRGTPSSISAYLSNAESINNHFVAAMSHLAADAELLDFYKSNVSVDAQFSFTLTTVNEVESVLFSIKSQSVGCDNISHKMLMLCCPHILPVITHIVNTCLLDNIFPDCWKISRIVPLAKNSSPASFNDLRSISILSLLSKILEKIIDRYKRF